MKQIMHFNSQKERLDFLKGRYEEIVPEEAKEEPKPKKARKTKKKNEVPSE